MPDIKDTSRGLVAIQTPEQLTASLKPVEPVVVTEAEPALVLRGRTLWEKAKKAKLEIEIKMLDSLKRRRGIYDQARMNEINDTGGFAGWYHLTATKCRTAAAWLTDILFQPGDKPWGCDPTPIPDLPGDIKDTIRAQIANRLIEQALQEEMTTGIPVSIEAITGHMDEALDAAYDDIIEMERDEAEKRSERMEDVIEDQLTEGGYYDALMLFIDDLVTFKAAIMKGPVMRSAVRQKWEVADGQWQQVATKINKMKFNRVSPFDAYPSPDALDVHDGPFIERMRLERKQIYELIGVPGFKEDAIREVLARYRTGGLTNWLWTDTERDVLRSNPYMGIGETDKIDCLQFWDSVPGSLLVDWGISVDDLEKDYEVNYWMIDGKLIKAALNPDKMGHRPYAKACFLEDPDSFYGFAPPELVKHDQDACNVLYRSTINNAAMSAMPLTEENVDRRAEGDPGGISPGKMFPVTDEQITGAPALRFHNVTFTAGELANVLEVFSKMGDDHSGVPAYAHGNEDVGGAGNTMGGLSMLMNQAAKGIQHVVRNIDRANRDIIGRVYDHNMKTHESMEIKGDMNVVARGSTALLIKEQSVIRIGELLNRIVASPTLTQISGPEGIEHLLKAEAKGLGIEADKVVPKKREMQNEAQEMPMGQEQQSRTLDAAGNPVAGQDFR